MQLPPKNSAFPGRTDKLFLVRRADEYIKDDFFSSRAPFQKQSFLVRLLKSFAVILTKHLEWWLGVIFFVENKHGEAIVFTASSRNLLSRFLNEGIIKSWEMFTERVGEVTMYSIHLHHGSIYGDNGILLYGEGSLVSRGVNTDPSAAMTTALAETIERFCMCNWSSEFFVKDSINGLQSKSKIHYDHSYFYPTLDIDKEEVFEWVEARDWLTGHEVYLPANMVFITYMHVYPEKCQFIAGSSSGCGAYSSKDKAMLSGLYELFERDGILMYWLNKLTPKQIDTSTFIDKHWLDIVSHLEKNDLSLNLLDCRTEFGIPVVAAVVIDKISGAVYLDCAAGFSIDKVIEKLLNEMMLATLGPTKPLQGRPVRDYKDILTIEDRRTLWRSGKMTEHMKFLLTGEKVSFTVYKKQFPNYESTNDELNKIKSILKSHDTTAYMYWYPQSIARENNLYVARMIVPKLLPAYFLEDQKHLNVQRIYTFAKNMGYDDKDRTVDDLNNIPHPVI